VDSPHARLVETSVATWDTSVYDKLVEALGGYGEFVEQPQDIRPAIERAIKSGKTALVNVCTDPDAQATTDMGFAGY